MSDQKPHYRLKYLFSYLLAVSAAFLSYKTFYFFKADAAFGNQIVFLNFGILLFLWFLSFVHTGFIRRNIFMVLVLPLLGLHISNFLLILTTPGTSILGYFSFVTASSLMIFLSYKARIYEKKL